MSDFKLVVFKLGKDFYGLRITDVREIVKALTPTSIPNTHDWVDGVVKLRNSVIPVLNLKKFLRFNYTSKEENMLTIVVDIEDALVGLSVDSVDGIYSSVEENIHMPLETIKQDFIEGIVQLDDKLVILLNTDNLLSSKGLEEIQTVLTELHNKVGSEIPA